MAENNALAKLASGGVLTMDSMLKGLGSIVTNTAGGGLTLPLLKKNGKASGWTVGQDGTPIDEDSNEDAFIVRTATLQHGYVAWKDGVPKHVMVSVFDSPEGPDKGSLGDQGQDTEGKAVSWQPCASVELEGIEGVMKGETVIFQNSTAGGLDFIGKLAKSVFTKSQQPGAYVQPVIRLRGSSYQHKNRSYGRIHKPEFEILGWMNLDDEPEPSGDVEVQNVEIVEEGAQASVTGEKPARRGRRRAES